MPAFTHALTRAFASRTRRLTGAAALTIAVTAATVTGCGTSAGTQSAAVVPATPTSAALHLDRPFPKPNLVLTDNHGHTYQLIKQTAGRPTLVYFGYTHCPDVCPTTMADIANAVRTLPAAERQRLKVIFVTTDPARDTPQRLNKWLAAFDPAFIGLTGDFDAIAAAARGLGVAVTKPVRNADGHYTVTHGAEVLAFFPTDDKAHVLYTSGVSPQQYAADLPKIIKGIVP
jgi:protein SCO1